MLVQSIPFPAGGGGGTPPAYQSTSAQVTALTPSYPAGIAAGDFLLGAVVGNATIDSDYSGPAGFTRLTQVIVNGSSTGGIILALFYKIADGSESGTATFTRTGGIANTESAAVSRFTGATSFESLVAGLTLDASTDPISSPQLTTTDVDRLLVNLFGSRQASTLTEEAGWTEGFDYVHNGSGATDTDLALHYAASGVAGAQTTEEPTPLISSSDWAMASLALCPFGTPPGPTIAVRGSRLTHVNNASSISFALPAGSQKGDSCVLFAAHGFSISGGPTGWNKLNASTGSNVNGAAYQKILTAADITAGTVTVTFSGAYYGAVAAITFVGCTGGLRTWAFTRDSTGASPRTVTTGAAPKAGDYAVYFGFERATTAAVTVDKGGSLQTLSAANASAALYGGAIAADGAVTANFSYSPTGSGDFQGIVVIAPGY